MNTAIEKNTSISDKAIQFLKIYHHLEKQRLEEGFSLIRKVFHSHGAETVSHMMDHWRDKKKLFGSFYLNTSYRTQIKILHEFGITSDQDAEYLAGFDQEDGEMKMFFVEPPVLCKSFKNLLVFFHNHGINEQTYDWLTLSNLPKTSAKRYGQSYNWAGYILSLDKEEQKRVLETILSNYEN